MAFFSKMKKNQCPYCPESFYTNEELGEHIKVHLDEAVENGVFLVLKIREKEPVADISGITTEEATAHKWAKRDKATVCRVISTAAEKE